MWAEIFYNCIFVILFSQILRAPIENAVIPTSYSEAMDQPPIYSDIAPWNNL